MRFLKSQEYWGCVFIVLAALHQTLHIDCFGEAMQLLREKLNQKNVYFTKPAIDI